jgi:hypothetical protein
VPGNPLGGKGVGESGIKGVGSAVSNALADAIGPAARLALTELPLRPDAISLLVPLDWESEPPAEPETPAPAAPMSARPAIMAAVVSVAVAGAYLGWRLARRQPLLPGGRSKK